MKTITHTRLVEILSAVKGTTAVTILAVTDARLRKTNNPYAPLGSCYKVARVNGMLNTDHEAAVNRAQVKSGVEPGYQAGQRSWGTRRGAIVEHEGKYFIPIQIGSTLRAEPIFVAPVVKGKRVRLVPVAKETLSPWLPPDRRAQEVERQGIETPVVRRDYALESIATIAINGERLRIRA